MSITVFFVKLDVIIFNVCVSVRIAFLLPP